MPSIMSPQKRKIAEPGNVEMSLPKMGCDKEPSLCKGIKDDHSYGTGKVIVEEDGKVLKKVKYCNARFTEGKKHQ